MALKKLGKAFERVAQADPDNLPFGVKMEVLMALIQLSFVPNSDKGRVAEVKKAFGENIRRLREDAGITQIEIANKTKFPQRQVSAIEIGEAHIAMYPSMMAETSSLLTPSVSAQFFFVQKQQKRPRFSLGRNRRERS